MALTICTGMYGPRRDDYARIFLASFDRHWPADVRLHLYSDPPDPAFGQRVAEGLTRPRQAQVSWLARTDGWAEFIARHQDDPIRCGREPAPGAKWKSGATAKGYNFKFDAVRFAGQAFIPEAAAKDLDDGDVLCWLDADVETIKAPPYGWIEAMIGYADGAYLGRVNTHSEIGFWAVRLSPVTRRFLQFFAWLYRHDDLFKLTEWHSAFAWDEARRVFEKDGLTMRDLTPGGRNNVFMASALSRFCVHHKGQRKGFLT